MSTSCSKIAITSLVLGLGAYSGQAAEFSLASSMDTSTGFTENAITGGQARIGLGAGGAGDLDGLYDISDDTVLFGSGFDLFPQEGDFEFGTISFDESGVTGIGVETVAVSSIDLSAFWQDSSTTTDVSDLGLDLWIFGIPNAFNFGGLDASDTVTFTNGVLTSIDVEIDASYDVFDAASTPVSWNGTLSISGSDIALTISDTEDFFTGFGTVPSTFTSDLAGTVEAVGVYVVPEPTSASLLGLAGLALVTRRRKAV